MSFLLKNIAVIGASGLIGTIILNGLIEASQFTITVITRKESNARFPAGVIVHRSDFSEADLEDAFKGKDAVISAVGAAAFGEQKMYVDAAVRAKVKRFIPSEFSADSQNEAVLSLIPLFGIKNELLRYLNTKEADGLTWTGIVPSLLFDWGLASGFLEFDIPNRKATIWDGGNKSFTLTNEKQLAKAVVSVLKHPQETQNQIIYIASMATTQNEILTALEEATETKWSVSNTTTNEQVSGATKKLAQGDFSAVYVLVRAYSYSSIPGLQSNYVKDQKLGNDLLGLELESVKGTVKRVVGN